MKKYKRIALWIILIVVSAFLILVGLLTWLELHTKGIL